MVPWWHPQGSRIPGILAGFEPRRTFPGFHPGFHPASARLSPICTLLPPGFHPDSTRLPFGPRGATREVRKDGAQGENDGARAPPPLPAASTQQSLQMLQRGAPAALPAPRLPSVLPQGAL
eukprot:gene13341-biopygen23039